MFAKQLVLGTNEGVSLSLRVVLVLEKRFFCTIHRVKVAKKREGNAKKREEQGRFNLS